MKLPVLSPSLTIPLLCHVSHVLAQSTDDTGFINVLASDPQLSNLTTYVSLYPRVFNDLLGRSNITFLAPSNDAFDLARLSDEGLPATTESLQAILSYHVLDGNYSSFTSISFVPTSLQPGPYANVTGGQRVEVVAGSSPVAFSGLLQNSTFTKGSTLDFNGGTIHVIDRFLTLPQNVSSTSVAMNLSASVGALAITNLSNPIDLIPDLTFFVPNNEAFQRIGGILAVTSVEEISYILEYHVTNGTVLYTTDLVNGSTMTALNGFPLSFTINGPHSYINNAKIIASNVLTSNGVIHVIDRVLNPNNQTALPGQEAFAAATSATAAPFTSGVPTPTSTIDTSAVASVIPTLSPSPSPSSNTVSKPNTGAIAGGVVGGVLGLALLAFLVWWFLKRKRSSSDQEKTAQNAAGAGGVGRSSTTKSYHKPELEAPTSPSGNSKLAPAPITSEINTPVSQTHARLSGTTMPEAELATQGNQTQQQQSPQQTQKPTTAQQQEQERLREQQVQEARMTELANQRRIAEIAHQKRMAQLDHEQRMAELDISAARLRSYSRTVSELEARANPGPGSAD